MFTNFSFKNYLKLFIITLAFFFISKAKAQTPDVKIEWVQHYEGLVDHEIEGLIGTQDNGCVFFGKALQANNRNKSWIAKINYMGANEWIKEFSTLGHNEIKSVFQTEYGGFIISGSQNNYRTNGSDVWLVKLDRMGVKEWENVVSLDNDNKAYSIVQTKDKGYIVCGETYIDEKDQKDCLVAKFDNKGKLEWTKDVGYIGDEIGYDIIQTEDGGYAVCGSQEQNRPGDTDIWIFKLDDSGKLVWQNTFGWQLYDYAKYIFETEDNGYAVAGFYQREKKANKDFWVIRLDGSNIVQWEQTFGGFGGDTAKDIIQTGNKNFLIVGNTAPSVESEVNFWIIRLNEEGDNLGDQEFLGDGSNKALFVAESQDKGFYILIKRILRGEEEGYWLLKIDTNFLAENEISAKLWETITDSGTDRPGSFVAVDRPVKYFFKAPPKYKNAWDSLTTPFPVYDPISHYYLRFSGPVYTPISNRFRQKFHNKYFDRLIPRFIPRQELRIYEYNPTVLNLYRTDQEGINAVGLSPLHERSLMFETPEYTTLYETGKVNLESKDIFGVDITYSLDTSVLIPVIFLWLLIFLLIIFKLLKKSH